MPVNKMDGKNKIIDILLALKRQDTNGVYFLDQGRVISVLVNVWGGDGGGNDTSLHHNDRILIYGLVIYIDVHRAMLQRLMEGCISRRHLDDPAFSLKHFFQIIVFVFNNNKISVDLPQELYGVVVIENVDPNDFSRIRITRDFKSMIN